MNFAHRLTAAAQAAAVALVLSACSKTADPAIKPAEAKPPEAKGAAASHKPGKEAPNTLAHAAVYACQGGGELKVVFDSKAGTAIVKLNENQTMSLPMQPSNGGSRTTYTDGQHTIGVDGGAIAYTDSPSPPRLCHAAPKAVEAPKVSGISRNLTAEDKGKTIEMKVGEKITVSLVGIPTAGYVWAADKPPAFVKVSDGPGGPTSSDQNQPGFTGGNHWEVLLVEATAEGAGDLNLVMRRPWEDKVEPDAERFKVTLKVAK